MHCQRTEAAEHTCHTKSSAASLETALNVYNYTQCWALASIYCARPVRCCVWASNPCCRYVFKMHMQWITSLAFDRMINYLQRCCKILPSMEWLISRGALNLTEMYEFGSISKPIVHLSVLSVTVCGVFMWVTDGERECERAEVHVCKGRREWLCCGGLRWEEWKSAKWDHRESRKRLYEISSYKEHHHAEIKDPLWRKSGFYCCLHVCLVFLISFQTKHVQIHQSTP